MTVDRLETSAFAAVGVLLSSIVAPKCLTGADHRHSGLEALRARQENGVMTFSVHWCLLDADCRRLAPAMLYIFIGSRVFRLSPPYDHTAKRFGVSPWSWPTLEHWRRP